MQCFALGHTNVLLNIHHRDEEPETDGGRKAKKEAGNQERKTVTEGGQMLPTGSED